MKAWSTYTLSGYCALVNTLPAASKRANFLVVYAKKLELEFWSPATVSTYPLFSIQDMNTLHRFCSATVFSQENAPSPRTEAPQIEVHLTTAFSQQPTQTGIGDWELSFSNAVA